MKNTNDTSLIFDITHEEIKNKKQVDDISLNGAKLIREQLNISENSKIKTFLFYQKKNIHLRLFLRKGTRRLRLRYLLCST